MLRPIWSHPECPTKEDIRDEFRDLKLKPFFRIPTSLSSRRGLLFLLSSLKPSGFVAL